ncbi:MAG: hypothetical protein J6I40_01005 [Mailhella sp.]|nr:hypothetical protein [Mailhella sp.]
MLNNPYLFPAATGVNSMLANPFAQQVQAIQKASLGLTQIEGFPPVAEFTDDANAKWTLVKSASDSTVDIPAPNSMQVVDYWNHDFPGLDKPVYIYVVEGIRQPRVDTEQPCRVLYQWFSKTFVKDFQPQMISENEWRKANVYAAPLNGNRIAKLKALCHVQSIEAQPAANDDLIKVEGLNGQPA